MIINKFLNVISVLFAQQRKDEHNWVEWPYKWSEIIQDYPGWDFRMWPLAAVTGFS